MRARPELTGKILTHGSWDYEFVEDIKPAYAAISVIDKALTRYNALREQLRLDH